MEGELSGFSSMYVNEEVDFMAQLFPNTNDQGQVGDYDDNINVEGGTYYYSSESTPNSQNVYYGSYRSDDYQQHDQFLAASSMPFEFLHCGMDGDNGLNNDGSNLEESLVDAVAVDRNCNSLDDTKKRARVTDEIKEKRYIIRGKKSRKVGIGSGGEEVEKEGELINGQSLTSGSPTSSKETNTTNLSSHGRTRASRGSATDPQSIYARKRRERINERLRILQSLVPNGTKVDISTMLEEAVHYVKFLQLQIKMLSSNDHWMYAPIAYNGLNIGLDFNIN